MKPLNAETFPIRGHRLIEASAGTGKTHTITNLYLRLLLGDDDDLEHPLAVNEILVLTFTIAATEELRRRIRDRIYQARLGLLTGEADDPFLRNLAESHQDDDKAIRLLTAALHLMDEAAIYTIHGFCARVLTEQSFETGVLFDQDLGTDRDMLLHQAVEDCFRAEILTLPPLHRAVALSLWQDPDQLEQAIKGLLFRPNLVLRPPYQDLADLEQDLVQRIDRVKQTWMGENIPEMLRNAGLHKGRKTITRLDQFTAFCESGEYRTDLWEHYTPGVLETITTKQGSTPVHHVFELIESIAQDWPRFEEQLVANLWNRMIAAVRERMNRYKIEWGQLTLDDLLSQVRDALQHEYRGELLAVRLANRWPVALVDEFQDTDDIQYEIFSRIYRRPGNQSLIFIGDPKQAIYQFRGADIFTYINAKRQVNNLYSLDTNWRSTEPVIDATNRLFNQSDIFLNDRDIPYIQVNPAERAKGRRIELEGNQPSPVSFWHIRGEGQPGVEEARMLAMERAAEETARLLNLGASGEALVDGEPLHAGQIAFLVRQWRDARAARSALRRRNIRSVYVTTESVFLSDTAADLKLILEAILEPTNDQALRAALAAPLLQSTAADIDSLNHDVIHQQQVLQEFLGYHRQWATQGIAAMIESLIDTQRLGEKWLSQPEGERQLTNLRHLSELLQKYSLGVPGMHRLLKWFEREQNEAESVSMEERQLRLESDQNLVQIVTMHAAKGLEYDVVMIPMAGFRSQPGNQEPALFHDNTDEGFQTVVDFGRPPDAVARQQSEQLAEDMRLLYVAITRAKYKCYVGIPNTRGIIQTAIGKLLNLDLTDGSADAIASHLADTFTPPLFSLEPVYETNQVTPFSEHKSKDALSPPDLPPANVDDKWQLHSYTGLAALASGHGPFSPIAGYGDDEQSTDEQRGEEVSRFTFPRGPRVGIALHDLLEQTDFQAGDEYLAKSCRRTLNRLGIMESDEPWLQMLLGWIGDIFATPLLHDDPFTLSDINLHNRLTELEFHFPLTGSGNIDKILTRSGYVHSAVKLENLRGMMTGLIDLVVEHDEKFYLIDYKSNHLGNQPADYATGQLQQAVHAHHYDLQYLIYCVALNRYLARRIPAYNYDSHFGGVMYLFLRGMQGQSYPGSGVFFDRPDEELITKLDRALGGTE